MSFSRIVKTVIILIMRQHINLQLPTCESSAPIEDLGKFSPEQMGRLVSYTIRVVLPSVVYLRCSVHVKVVHNEQSICLLSFPSSF